MNKVKLRLGNYAFVDDEGELISRTCTKCNELLIADAFYKNDAKKFGKEQICRECRSKEGKDYNKRNPRAEYRSNYRKENRELLREKGREYYSKNTKKYRVRDSKRRAIARGLPSNFTVEERRKVEEYFGGEGICALTGESADVHFDHVIPVATGSGGTVVGNMIPLSDYLNRSKGTKNIFLWFNEKKDSFNLSQEVFSKVIGYLAKQNNMTVFEYTVYVYSCHEEGGV